MIPNAAAQGAAAQIVELQMTVLMDGIRVQDKTEGGLVKIIFVIPDIVSVAMIRHILSATLMPILVLPPAADVALPLVL